MMTMRERKDNFTRNGHFEVLLGHAREYKALKAALAEADTEFGREYAQKRIDELQQRSFEYMARHLED